MSGSLDAIAHAIASGPRRRIIERLSLGTAAMSDLADATGLSLPAVDKHLRLLGEAGIVTKAKNGRSTQFRLRPGSLDELGAWALQTQLLWGNALDRLDTHLAAETSHNTQEPQ